MSHGYTIAAEEVPVPNRGVRLDVAGYRPGRRALGHSAVFECKVSSPDFRRDARPLARMTQRLEVLHARKRKIEEELKLIYPSLRNGDSLFPEYDTLDFERPGDERYGKVLREIQQLTRRLYENTKFDRLTHWASANLFYLVCVDGVLRLHELPFGWGLLQLTPTGLELIARPVWHEVTEAQRLEFLHRIAARATTAAVRNTLPPQTSDPAGAGECEA